MDNQTTYLFSKSSAHENSNRIVFGHEMFWCSPLHIRFSKPPLRSHVRACFCSRLWPQSSRARPKTSNCNFQRTENRSIFHHPSDLNSNGWLLTASVNRSHNQRLWFSSSPRAQRFLFIYFIVVCVFPTWQTATESVFSFFSLTFTSIN